MTYEAIKAKMAAEEAAAEQTQTFKGYSVADLRKVSDAVFDPSDWRKPFAVYVPASCVPMVMAAAEFFHADTPVVAGIQPLTGKVLVEGKGYQAW